MFAKCIQIYRYKKEAFFFVMPLPFDETASKPKLKENERNKTKN